MKIMFIIFLSRLRLTLTKIVLLFLWIIRTSEIGAKFHKESTNRIEILQTLALALKNNLVFIAKAIRS